MSKEPIYMRLHEGTLFLLKREAKKKGISQSSIVEKAIGLYLETERNTNPDVYTRKYLKGLDNNEEGDSIE